MRLTHVAVAALTVTAAAVAAHPAQHVTATSPAPLPPSVRSAAKVVDAFHAALGRGDTETAKSLLADDALIFEEGAAERSKAEYAAEHLGADAAFTQVVPPVLAQRSGGAVGQMAWVASEGRLAGTYKGKPIDGVTTETMVLRRSGPDWKIVHIHWSSAATKH